VIHPETNGWRLTGRAVWAIGGAGITSLADALRAAGAQVTVSPTPRAASWAEDASQAIGRLDGLILVLEDPADDPGADARPGVATTAPALPWPARSAISSPGTRAT
jgi:hypothetical protein